MDQVAEVGEHAADAVALLARAHAALAAAADGSGSLSALDATQLMAAAEHAAAVVRLADAVIVRTVHAVEDQCRRAEPDRSVACAYGFRDAAALMMSLTGASRRTLTRWRHVAAATTPRGVGSTGLLPPLFPRMASAFAAGAVSLDQSLVIRQHLLQASSRAHPEALDAAERALVAAAAGSPVDEDLHDDEATALEHMPQLPLSPELLGVQARAWRDAIDPDGPEPTYEEQRRERSFTLGRRTDGMWVGKLLLPPDQGEALRLALDAHNAPRTPIRYGDEDGDPSTPAGGSPTTAVDEPGASLHRHGRLDDRSTAQRQADTLVGLITRAMELADAPRIGGEAATLVVTISESELAEHARTGAGVARLDQSGEQIPAHVAARILCDGHIQACLLNDDGLPLKLGRARRSHTPHQRRAILTAYPGGCQNPGCHAPPGFTEIHHPVWWSQGGETDVENGIPLCQHCHIELHAGRLRCVRDGKGRWLVVPSVRLRGRLTGTA